MAGNTRSEPFGSTKDSPFVPDGSDEPLVAKQLSPVLRTSSLFVALSFLALTLMVDGPEARRYGSTCLLISLGFHLFTIGVGVQLHIGYIYLMDHVKPERRHDYSYKFRAYLLILTCSCCIGSIFFIASIPISFAERTGGFDFFFCAVIFCTMFSWIDIYNHVRSFDSKMKIN